MTLRKSVALCGMYGRTMESIADEIEQELAGDSFFFGTGLQQAVAICSR